MRVALWVLGLVALATVATLVGGPSDGNEDVASKLPRPSVAFCKAAGKYDDAVSSHELSVAEHLEFSRAIAAAAPKDARADADRIVRAYEQLQAGNRRVVDDPGIKAAINHVNRRAGQDCGWYRREGGL